MKLIFSSPFLSLLLIPSLVVSTLPGQNLTTARDLAGPNLTTSADLQLRMVESDGPEAKVNSTPSKGFTVGVTNASGAAVSDAAVAVRLPDSGPTGTFADGSHSTVLYTDSTGRAQIHGLRWSQTPGAVVMRVTATKGSSHAALLMNETLTSDAATTVVEIPSPPSQPQQPAVPQPGQPAAKSQVIIKTAAPPPSTAITPRPLSPTAAASAQPSVSVSGGSPDGGQHGSKTKWIILAAVVAGAAGGAFAFVGKGKSNPAPAQNGLTIGTPSISVGHP